MTTSTTVNKNATKATTSSKKKKPTAVKSNEPLDNTTGLIEEHQPPLVEVAKTTTSEVAKTTTSEVAKTTTSEVAKTTTTTDTKGRKTRGSKIVTKQQIATTIVTPPLTNVILNLKCSMSDLREYNNKLNQMISNPLEYNSSAPPDVKYYDGEKSFSSFVQNDNNKTNSQTVTGEDQSISNAAFLSFPVEELGRTPDSTKCRCPWEREAFDDSTEKRSMSFADRINHASQEDISSRISSNTTVKIFKNEIDEDIAGNSSYLEDVDNVNIKDMSAKLKQLKIQLYKNTLNSEKKSACFWCTYDFDNSPCYIPKYEMDGTIYGYGSFCRPECAVAYLMKETIDDSTKFDRYHLLNQIYSKVYECKKNIKPAPDPHYLLDKFYGNLNIQEYRRLLKTEHLLLVIDKPLTRILPELHEDTDDAFTKIYGIKATSGNSSGVYKVKRQSEQPQGPSKASIIKNTFGIST